MMESVVLYINLFFFFFNDTATTEIYTLSLHDAPPISVPRGKDDGLLFRHLPSPLVPRSAEHTSELQSRRDLVCRLLLEKKKNLSMGVFLVSLHPYTLKLFCFFLG